jgi:hypothetical protein
VSSFLYLSISCLNSRLYPTHGDRRLRPTRLCAMEATRYYPELRGCSSEITTTQEGPLDSICIDRSSTAERNHQMKHMGEIHGQAEKVIVWHGESIPQNEIAFKYFKRIHAINSKRRLLFRYKRNVLALEREIDRLKGNSSLEVRSYQVLI